MAHGEYSKDLREIALQAREPGWYNGARIEPRHLQLAIIDCIRCKGTSTLGQIIPVPTIFADLLVKLYASPYEMEDFIHNLVQQALARNATEIRFEHAESGFQAGFVVDGAYHASDRPPPHDTKSIIPYLGGLAGDPEVVPARIMLLLDGRETDFSLAVSKDSAGSQAVLVPLQKWQ